MKILVLFLLALPTWASLGSISFTVPNCSGVARSAEGQTPGVPIPIADNILDVRNLMVTDSTDTIVASHETVTERWGGTPSDVTKAIKWVRIDNLATVASTSGSRFCSGNATQTGGGATYKLKDRTGADPPLTGVTVTTDSSCSASCKIIDTGAVTYKFRSDLFNGPDSVVVDGGGPTLVSSSLSNGLQIVANGTTYTSASAGTGTPAYSIVVEEPNGVSNENETGATVRAQLHISGAFWNGSNRLGSYDARLIFYAGQSWFKFELAPIYNFDLQNTLNMPTDVAFVMGSSLGNSLTASFGTQYGTSGTSQSVNLTNLQDVYFVQYDHGNNFNASFLCNNDARNCPGLNLQGWSIVKGTTTQFTGHQGDGWINLTDATNSITGWMRDFWQNYPTELEAAGKVLKFHFWPVHGDTPVDGNPNGFLTMITGYKRDQALKGNSGFYLIWPFQTGGAMNMTPVSPNPGRTITAATATNPATITSAGIAHLDNSASDTPCVGPCLYWQPGQKHLVALSGFSGGTWATANTFLLASPTTPTSTTFNLYNLNGTNFDATGLGIPVVTSAKVGALDTQTDVNAAGFAKRYELVISFQTGTGTPATLVPKWRDTLLFTNPTYFTDTAQPWGRVHARDTVNFPQAEKELDALLVNVPRKDLFFNNYGMPYWGVAQYGTQAAGFGNRYLITYRKNRMFVPWLQWMRTGDPTFYQMGRAYAWFGGEVPVQHIPSYQRDATPGVFFDTWHLQDAGGNPDAVGNVLIKHNGSGPCTEGWGSSLWFNSYNINTTNPVAPPGATTQRCPDGQQPYLEYPTTGLLADYLIAGDDRDATLVTDVADNVLFSASGSTHNSIVCGSTEPGCGGVDSAALFVSGGNTGPAAGRANGGCLQSMGDAHELTWSQGSTHNYVNMGIQCLKAGMSATNHYTRWVQNPTGFLSFSFGIPSTRYGQNYFATNWNHWPLPNFADIVGNISIPAPSFATAPANVSINLFDIVNKVGKATGYVNTAAATGLMSFLVPGRVMASAYHNTSDTLLRDMMGREMDFFVMGADDDGSTTGCKNLGNAFQTGAIPVTNCPLGTLTPDVHVWAPFALGVPYWESELLAHPPSIPNLPPVGWQIPAVGATNGPLNFLVHNPTPAATITVSFMLRAENSSSFTGGSPILPSGDITLQVLNSTNSPIPFTISNASGTVTITGASATVKTPTQEALAFAPPGTTSCLVAPDPPSINYTLDGNNNLDNRYWTVTFSGAAVGDYQYQFTSKVCPGGATFHIATPVATSTGNIDTVICTPPCNVIGNFAKTEVGSAYYFNVPSGVTALRTDSNQTHTLVDPIGNFYRGGTVLTTTLNSGYWKVQTFGPWQDYTLNSVTFGGTGGVKPLACASPATCYDSPSYSNIAFVTVPSNPITLNFSGASITTPSPLPTGTVVTPITPVMFACSGCATISNWSVISGSLPNGLSLGGTLNATLSGTPSLAGTYNFTIQATDGVNNPTKPFTMVVNGLAIITTPSPLPDGTEGTPITPITFACSGCGSISNWSVVSGSLPTGLGLGSALNATLSGTPTLAGTYNFTIQATDGVTNPTKPFTMVINNVTPPGLGGTVVLGVTVSSGVTITK